MLAQRDADSACRAAQLYIPLGRARDSASRRRAKRCFPGSAVHNPNEIGNSATLCELSGSSATSGCRAPRARASPRSAGQAGISSSLEWSLPLHLSPLGTDEKPTWLTSECGCFWPWSIRRLMMTKKARVALKTKQITSFRRVKFSAFKRYYAPSSELPCCPPSADYTCIWKSSLQNVMLVKNYVSSPKSCGPPPKTFW